MAAIEAIRDRLFQAARAQGRHEPSEACAADALAELARCGGAAPQAPSARSRAKIIVRVDLPALLRSLVATGEVCELAGFGPVTVSAVRDLIDTGDPFLAAVVTRGEHVVGVAHLGRRPTAHQQSALEWLYPTCAVEGCSSLTWLVNVASTGPRATPPCSTCSTGCAPISHDLKSLEGWGLVAGHGKRQFVPPDDPRHPRASPAAESAA